MQRFAREDPRVRGHLDVIRRKELLELVLRKMDSLRVLEGREVLGGKGGVQMGAVKEREREREGVRGRWSLF